MDLSRLLRGAETVAYLWEELAGAGERRMSGVNIADIDDGPLGPLALSRSGVDRVTQRRGDTAWLAPRGPTRAAGWWWCTTRQAPGHRRDGQLGLVFVPPAEAPEGIRFLLGVDAEGGAYFGVIAADAPWERSGGAGGVSHRPFGCG